MATPLLVLVCFVLFIKVEANSEVEDLKMQVAKLSQGLFRLGEENKRTMKENGRISKENRQISSEIERLRKLSLDHDDVLKMLSQKVENAVAFTVSTNGDVTIGSGEKVPFQDVLTNVGAGYNAGTNEFVCPYSGVYLFSIAASSQTSGGQAYRADQEIYMDGVGRLTTAFAQGTTGIHGTASSTVTVQCTAGSKVYVRCRHVGITCDIAGFERSNVFSGLLYSNEA